MSNTLCCPIAVFYENEIVIEVDLLKQFDNEKEAQDYADLNWELYLLPTGKIGESHLVLMLGDRSFSSDLDRDSFRIYTEGEKYHSRRKLDPKDPDDYAIIMSSCGDRDSPYFVTKDDFELVDWDVEKLAKVVGCPVKFGIL